MPIVFLSPECKNEKLSELEELIPAFDFVFTSENEACQDLCDLIAEKIPCMHLFSTEKLNLRECSRENFNTVVNKFSLRTGSVLIIAQKEYFNILIPGFMTDEWQTLSFEEKFLI